MSGAFSHGYALLIGVGESAHPKWSLPVTVKDMQALRTALTDPALCGYPDDDAHIRLLHDTGATKQAILDGLDWLAAHAAADPEATAIVYYSGHGWVDDDTGRYYLLPHDVKPFSIAQSALPAVVFTEALHRVVARRLLVFVDSCHAAGMATAKDGPASELPDGFSPAALPKGVVEGLKQGAGRAVFTSSLGAQRSWTRPDGNLSLYTFHLIEALQGAGNQPGDTTVRVSNLMNHLGRAVSESARTLCQAEQTPFFDTATEDFPVALLHGGKGRNRVTEEMGQLEPPDLPGIEAETKYRNLVAALDERLSFPLSGLSFNAMLEEVYEPLLIARTRPTGISRPARPGDRLRIDTMLQEGGSIMALLGSLGGGKTTTLRYLNWAYALRPESQLLWRMDELIPFYLTARDLARARQKGDDLISICADTVAHRLGHPYLSASLVQRVLQSTLNNGNALILIDALDEYRAPDTERNSLLTWLAGIWRTQPFQDNLLLLTSRPYAFTQVGFQAYDLQPPAPSQVGNLAHRLGRVLLQEQSVTVAEQEERLRGLTTLVGSSQMRDFASPFYVTLLTLAICRSSHFAEGLAQARSIGRLADLYCFFLRQTIRWEKEKPVATAVDEEGAYLALAELGWRTFVDQPEREALEINLLPADDRRKALTFWQRTGLLEKDAYTDEWRFHHTGFQLFGVALMLDEAWKHGQQAKIKQLQDQTKAIHSLDWDTIWELFFSLRGGAYGCPGPE